MVIVGLPSVFEAQAELRKFRRTPDGLKEEELSFPGIVLREFNLWAHFQRDWTISLIDL
jgi:hypothetical protein